MTSEPPPTPEWPPSLLERLAHDRRIVGAADLTGGGCARGVCTPPSARVLLVVTTWDGRDPVAAALPDLGSAALGAPAAIGHHDGVRWTGVASDARRVEIEVVGIGDLKPAGRGETARVVHDTNGLVEQWIRWSRGRDREREVSPGPPRAARLLEIDGLLRELTGVPPGAVAVRSGGVRVPIRPRLAAALRERRKDLDETSPAEASLAARIDAALASCPHAGTGLRVVPGHAGPDAALDSFLRVADGEGFLGDRILFDAAVKRLAELSRRAPAFDEGYVLPSFDAVEARWRFGSGIGGCRTPLVPGVHVGVGVTPADALEFWAAPFVREPGCDVACVADAGTRVVVARTAGRESFFGALLGEVDRAWDELPDLLRAARRSGRTPAGDVEAALRPLHLPRSYREAARALWSGTAAPSRLHVALALARAGSDQEPVNARKFGLAAGRFLGLTPVGDPAGGADGCDA